MNVVAKKIVVGGVWVIQDWLHSIKVDRASVQLSLIMKGSILLKYSGLVDETLKRRAAGQ